MLLPLCHKGNTHVATHSHTHTHTNTLPTHPHTYALWAVAAKHARQFISLLQGAFATLFLYFHLIRSFHSIVYAQLIGWDSFKRVRVRGRGMSTYSIELCPRRTRATCERVEYSASTVFASHARTHARTQNATKIRRGTEGSNSEREPWLLT